MQVTNRLAHSTVDFRIVSKSRSSNHLQNFAKVYYRIEESQVVNWISIIRFAATQKRQQDLKYICINQVNRKASSNCPQEIYSFLKLREKKRNSFGEASGNIKVQGTYLRFQSESNQFPMEFESSRVISLLLCMRKYWNINWNFMLLTMYLYNLWCKNKRLSSFGDRDEEVE